VARGLLRCGEFPAAGDASNWVELGAIAGLARRGELALDRVDALPSGWVEVRFARCLRRAVDPGWRAGILTRWTRFEV
jgi:hypothetical protein